MKPLKALACVMAVMAMGAADVPAATQAPIGGVQQSLPAQPTTTGATQQCNKVTLNACIRACPIDNVDDNRACVQQCYDNCAAQG